MNSTAAVPTNGHRRDSRKKLALNDQAAALWDRDKQVLERIHGSLTDSDFFVKLHAYLDLTDRETPVVAKRACVDLAEVLRKRGEVGAAEVAELFGGLLADVITGRVNVARAASALLDVSEE